MAELLDDELRGQPVRSQVIVDASERGVMLLQWLDELVFLAESEALVPETVEDIELSARRLVATVSGHRGRPRTVVKGATYHRLMFDRAGRGFHATVVLDV